MSPSAVASLPSRATPRQVFLAARCFLAGAGVVQLFTRAAETFFSFCTSSSDLPAAIASLISLHETVDHAMRLCAANAGEPTSTAVARAATIAKPIRFT